MTDYEHIDAGFRSLRADIMALREELLTTRREVVKLRQWAEAHLRHGHVLRTRPPICGKLWGRRGEDIQAETG